MSIIDYQFSKQISQLDYPFYAIVMAAMRQADTDNLIKLKLAFPDIWTELYNRTAAPHGRLISDSR